MIDPAGKHALVTGGARRVGAAMVSALAASGVGAQGAERSPVRSFPLQRSQWERLALTDDVELHVRRPLSRDANRRVEKLIEEARKIFEEG